MLSVIELMQIIFSLISRHRSHPASDNIFRPPACEKSKQISNESWLTRGMQARVENYEILH